MPLKDRRNVIPGTLQDGDELVVVVKFLKVHGRYYRIYLCNFEGEKAPQGSRIYPSRADAKKIVGELFGQVAEGLVIDV